MKLTKSDWRGCAIGARCVSDSAPSQTPHKGDTKMKLTKSDIKQKGGSEVSPRRHGGLTPEARGSHLDSC